MSIAHKKSVPQRLSTRLLALSCLSMSLLMAGCGTVSPVAFEARDIQDRVARDKVQMYVDQEPISAPIDFQHGRSNTTWTTSSS